MSYKSMREHVVTLTDESSAVAGIYLDHAIAAILNRMYPFETDGGADAEARSLPKCYEPRAERIAVYLVNKRGAEGEISHNENGIYRGYEKGDIPESMLSDILPMVKIPGGKQS